ncbi:MAG TPA: sigma-54 dependent transcriptional regulator [Polyangiaceae bacterium]|nr:sigma-54 dependent transcriptional regulator [Polyangiaceae bacterium]
MLSSTPALARELEPLLAARRLATREAPSSALAERELDSGKIELLLIDVADDAGMKLVAVFAASHPECAIVAVTPATQIALGVQAARSGAADFVRYPCDAAEVSYVIGKVLTGLEHDADQPPPSGLASAQTTMIANAPAMQELLSLLRRAASGMATVLVRGESGSGKELILRQLHAWSARHGGPFVKVHCGALPDNLLESELFGYDKGAFTGASAAKPGRVEVADGGTLFLDEIGDITPSFQVKLLRLLQDREYERLGSNIVRTADVRFVAATHKNLESMVSRGEFREDLFYRLNVIALHVPPLRARPGDIEALALHFCDNTSAENGRARAMFDADALELLCSQRWPGNVRQLQNFVERLIVLADSPRVSRQDVARELARTPGTQGLAAAGGFSLAESAPSSTILELEQARNKAEKHALEKALHAAKGNRVVAARLLGISRRALYYKLAEHGVA